MDGIDWPGIRAAAIAVGIREAARQAAASQPPEDQQRLISRILRRSSREEWLTKSQVALSTAVATRPNALSTPVHTGAETVANVIAENKLKTRTGLSKYAADAACKLGASSGNLMLSRPAKDIADILGKVWPEQTGGTSTFNFSLLCDQAAIQVISPDPGVSE